MSIHDDGGDVDRLTEWIVALFNAADEPVVFTEEAITGVPLSLHPVLRSSSDAVVVSSSFDAVSGTFEVPARTTAVFQGKRPVEEQLRLVIRDVEALVDAGALNRGNGNALIVKLRAAIASLQRGRDNAAENQLGAFLNQVDAFEQAGKLTPEQAGELRGWVEAALDCIGEDDPGSPRGPGSGASGSGSSGGSDEGASRGPVGVPDRPLRERNRR